MWKYPPFLQFLRDLVKVDSLTDIVLIDNNPDGAPDDIVLKNPKIQYITFGKNIFVNPGWNIGVHFSKNKKVLILSDDVIFDFKLFFKIPDYINENNGAVGICQGLEKYKHKQPTITDGSIDIIPCTSYWGPRTWGFGALMAVHKDSWIDIPEGLNFWYGDNWIYETNFFRKKTNYQITNMFHQTPGQVTVKPFITNEIRKTEKETYQLKIDEFKKNLGL